MAKMVAAAKGETLRAIAERTLGDVDKAHVIADYNALSVGAKLVPGQQLWIPSARELSTPRSARNITRWPAVPVGYQAICDTFGDLMKYVRQDLTIEPKWEADQMATIKLPFPIPLSWDTRKQATSIRCHRLLVPLFTELFTQIVARGLKGTVKTYGGCYQYRAKRNGSKPSAHSWGIAIDLNTTTNGMGTAGDMDPRLIDLFESYGFVWGGHWRGRGKDPMHFQYCGGY